MSRSDERLFSQGDHRRFLWLLGLVTGLMALGLAATALFAWRQARDVEATARLHGDSLMSVTFQLEREFLRTRHELQLALMQPGTSQWQSLQERHDILVSRIHLLMDNPTVADLKITEEYQQLMPQLERLQAMTDPLMEQPWAHRTSLLAVLHRMQALGPAVQALSLTANRQVALKMEDQLNRVQSQDLLMRWMVAAQAALLLMAALGLWWRHRIQRLQHLQMKQLNLALAQARDQAEQASLTKSQFLANMSHELRTPFNGMLGMICQLEQGNLTPQQKDQLSTAHQSAQHLLNLLNDILDLSALDAGKLKITPQPAQMRAVIGEVQQWMQTHAEQKQLGLQVRFDRDCPDWVQVDPTRVRQIMLNLLSNAIKFTDHGQVTVDVACVNRDNEAVSWSIQVRDTGTGMDEATLGQLFQRFHRGDGSLTRQHGGTGLGLEISRTLARRMQGDIVASSTLGQGSCFTLSLTTPISQAPSPAPQMTVSGPEPQRQVWHVLVAEDHPVNRKVLGIMLRNLGHVVSFAEDGAQALGMVREQDFDLVLMDIHMPNMDGLDSARAIRALPGPRAHVPIIAVTADIMNEAEERSLQAGMDDFISKPIEPQRLQSVMTACKARPTKMVLA